MLRWVHMNIQLRIILSLWPLLQALVWPPVAMSVFYEFALQVTAEVLKDEDLT